MSATILYGWLAHGVVIGALVSLLPLGDKRRIAGLLAIPIALFAGPAALLHGFVGTPSVTLLLLAIWQLSSRAPTPLDWRAAWSVIGIAVLFYPLALGLGPFDPYAIGYQPWPLLLAIGTLAVALLRCRREDWLLILSAGLAGYAGGLFANLWDALLDPLLVLAALAVVAGQLARRRTAG